MYNKWDYFVGLYSLYFIFYFDWLLICIEVLEGNIR